jgi:trans-2,3-dihydro-3-hydroxyanthranilate isomerase
MPLARQRYVTADVFTDQVFGGNPLAVILDALGLSTAEMQAIALEFNYSETTFVLPPRDSAHTAQIRIFTPRAEIPFAGHPNVGTAFLLARQREFLDAARTDQFVFEESAGLVPLKLIRERGAIIGAELKAPERLSCRARITQEAAAASLSLPPHDVAVTTHAPQVVSVGLPFLVVELASREALRRAKPNLAVYSEMLPLDGADAVYAYTQDRGHQPRGGESVLHARMFSPLDGIVEDPATGSATAAAIALLATHSRDSLAERLWRVHQGVDMGRPSLLLGRTEKRNGDIDAVHIGGRCVAVLEGSFVAEADKTARPL